MACVVTFVSDVVAKIGISTIRKPGGLTLGNYATATMFFQVDGLDESRVDGSNESKFDGANQSKLRGL